MKKPLYESKEVFSMMFASANEDAIANDDGFA
jgi:hypothetical protein